MDIKQIPVDQLKSAEYNPRKLSPKQFQDIKNSLTEFGLVQPIVANSHPDRKGVIIGGHQRWHVAKEMGMETVPVFWIEIADVKQEQALNLRLNKNQASWDFDMLANFDDDILLGVGFEPAELDKIFELSEPDDEKSPEQNPPDVARAEPGKVYTLGEHRLMCGDSTKPEDLDKLMAGEVADLVFTDPPYNVNYSGRGKNTDEGIENDNMTEEAFGGFCDAVFKNMQRVMKDGAIFYVCSGWSSYPPFYKALCDNGLYRAGVIIWVKNSASLGWNDYRYKHEWILVGKKKEQRVKGVPILYGWKKGEGHYFRDTRDEVDVWECPKKASSKYKHPTEKPVWLVEKAIANSSERGQIVLDLFGGGGSTLVATNRLKRKARLMEYDPKYVDVIISRYCHTAGIDKEQIYAQS